MRHILYMAPEKTPVKIAVEHSDPHRTTPPSESRKITIVGGPLEKDFASGEMSPSISDIMTPLGAIIHIFRELKLEAIPDRLTSEQLHNIIAAEVKKIQAKQPDSEKDLRNQKRLLTELAAVESTYLPMLRSAIEFWTGNDEFGNALRIDAVHDAFQHIVREKRVPIVFIGSVLKKYSTLASERKIRSAVDALSGKPAERIMELLTAHTLDDISSKMTSAVQQEIQNRIATTLKQRTIITAEEEAHLWRDGGPPFTELVKERNIAREKVGSGLKAIADQLLHKLYVTLPGSDRPINAATRILQNVGPNRLISDALTTPLQGAQRFYFSYGVTKGIVALELPWKEGETIRSIGQPISIMLAALSPEYQEMVGTEHERKEAIEYAVEQLRGHVAMRVHSIARSIDKKLSPALQNAVRDVSESITVEAVHAAYTKAAKAAVKKSAGAVLIENVPAHPDEFARLQKIFTDELFSSATKEGAPTLHEIIREITGLDTVIATGLWRDSLVSRELRSYDLESDEGAKRQHVDRFMSRLVDIVRAVDTNSAYTDAEKHRIKLAAQAMQEITEHLRSERLRDSATATDGERKTTAEETPRLLRNYADLFRKLSVTFKILQPLSGEAIYPPRNEHETDEEYHERLRAFIHTREKQTEAERRAFSAHQADTTIKHVHTFLQRMDTKEALGGIFVGSLWQILNKSGEELKSAIRDKMLEIEQRPPVGTVERVPEVATPVSENIRVDIETVLRMVEQLEIRLKEFPSKIQEIEAQMRFNPDPDGAARDYAAAHARFHAITKADVFAIGSRARPWRHLSKADPAYHATRFAINRADSVLIAHDTLRSDFEQLRRKMWHTLLLSELRSVRRDISNPILPEKDRAHARARLTEVERLIQLYIRASGLTQRAQVLAQNTCQFEEDLRDKRLDPDTTDDEIAALSKVISESHERLTQLQQAEHAAWEKCLKDFVIPAPTLGSKGANLEKALAAQLELREELTRHEARAREVLARIIAAREAGDTAALQAAQAELEHEIAEMERIEKQLS